MGFSQGGMMALHVSTRLDEAVAGVVSFSGALLAPEKLTAEITATPKTLLVHGRDDEIVPFQAMAIAEAVLAQNGVAVTAVARDGLGHGIDPDGFRQAVEFIGG